WVGERVPKLRDGQPRTPMLRPVCSVVAADGVRRVSRHWPWGCIRRLGPRTVPVPLREGYPPLGVVDSAMIPDSLHRWLQSTAHLPCAVRGRGGAETGGMR